MKYRIFYWQQNPEHGNLIANLMISAKPADVEAAHDAGMYEHIASVEFDGGTVGDDLERIFHDMNSIDSAWYEDEKSAKYTKLVKKARSMSMGDVVLDEDTGWVCASMGWTALSPDLFKRMIAR